MHSEKKLSKETISRIEKFAENFEGHSETQTLELRAKLI